MKNDLNYAVELIRKANGILITAGAGMSVDSGLSDFRGKNGFGKPILYLKNVTSHLKHWLNPKN